ncbi:serine hydrolase [Streptomyces sp. NPDC055287]
MDVAYAVSEVGSGCRAVQGEGRFPAASIVKVGILAALLLRAQDEGRAPGPAQRACAEAMIRRSDNDAASALWTAIGGAPGLDAAQARLGLTETTADPAWGRTRTTAGDQVTLLRAVFGSGRGRDVLDEDSRTYIGSLMGQVAAGQDWGVSAAGHGAALKNGWMPRDATGLWAVHSIGRVRAPDGRELLVAVLSEGHATKEAGIRVVEEAARAAAEAGTGPGSGLDFSGDSRGRDG